MHASPRSPVRKVLGAAAVPVAAILLFLVIMAVGGANPAGVVSIVIHGSFGSRNAILETFVKAGPILLCAIAVAVPGRAGLINIGGEGQLLAGAIAATWLVRALGSDSAAPSLGMMAIAAAIGGCLVALIPALLRASLGLNEVVTSLLLNYVVALFVLHLIQYPWRDPASLGWAQSAPFPPADQLAHYLGSRLHTVVLTSPFICALLYVIYGRTSWGFTTRIVESSPATASYLRLQPGTVWLVSFAIGGAVAGVAGFGEVAGIHYRLREGISLGYGYAGFLAAWLARNRFEWLPLTALFLGVVIAAGDALQVDGGLPFASVNILQGILLLAVLLEGSVRERRKQFQVAQC